VTRLLGLDIGTTSVKAVAVDPDTGAVLDSAQAEYPLLTPQAGWAEQDPLEWWRATEKVLDRLDGRRDVASIGLSGQMHGLVALDAEDRPLRPAILWNDQRTAAQCRAITERVGAERLLELTGNPALTGFTAPKLLWIREHEPEVWERISSVMLPKDYVRLRLSGERATDVTDASGTLLFDVANRAWSEELCEELEVPAEWLPVALESPVPSGHTAAGVPVAAGAGDQAAGAVGVGVVAPGPVSLVLGTSGVVFGALDSLARDPRLHTF
jgi:xylulokinase